MLSFLSVQISIISYKKKNTEMKIAAIWLKLDVIWLKKALIWLFIKYQNYPLVR